MIPVFCRQTGVLKILRQVDVLMCPGYIDYHLTKQVLALMQAIKEQFQGYLLWKPFLVKTDNNPFVHIITTSNSDAIQHHWVESLARSTCSIEYMKGWNNAAADALSQVT